MNQSSNGNYIHIDNIDFPNFSGNAANFPNSKGPGPIPKKGCESPVILQTRSEVKVTQKWNWILRHQKMHPHTKFGILTYNNIRNAPYKIFLKTRSEVEVTVTHKMAQDLPPSQDAFIHQNWDSYLK